MFNSCFLFYKSWMHPVQKPLVSSSFLSTASSLHFHFLSSQSSSNNAATSPTGHSLEAFQRLFFPLFLFNFPFFCLNSFLHSHISCHLSSHLTHLKSMLFPLSACSYSYTAHWCHLSASNETQHRKKNLSPFARTFRPPWIIHIHISAACLLTPREVLLFSNPSNEIWMAFFYIYILPGMIVSLRWV